MTPDHVNPERPWPHLDALRTATAAAGFELRERLTVHPEYVVAGHQWLDSGGGMSRRWRGPTALAT